MNAKDLVAHIRRTGGDTDFLDGTQLPTIASFIEKYKVEFDAFIASDPSEKIRKDSKTRMKAIAAYVRKKLSKECTVEIDDDTLIVSYNENLSPGDWFENKISKSPRWFELNESVGKYGVVDTIIFDSPDMQAF